MIRDLPIGCFYVEAKPHIFGEYGQKELGSKDFISFLSDVTTNQAQTSSLKQEAMPCHHLAQIYDFVPFIPQNYDFVQ